MDDANRCGNARIDGLAAAGRLRSVWDRLAYKQPAIAEHADSVWAARKSGAIRRMVERDARFTALLDNQDIGPQTEAEWALLARATLAAIGKGH